MILVYGGAYLMQRHSENDLERSKLALFCRWISYKWAVTRENLSSGFPTKWGSNQSPQLQRLARKLKFHLYQVYIWYFQKKEKQWRWSVCADAQAGLRLCCSQTSEDRFFRVEAQIWLIHQVHIYLVFCVRMSYPLKIDMSVDYRQKEV